jgi:hypothetical protein
MDLSRVDFSTVNTNIHALRIMAVNKPWSFYKIVEEVKKNYGTIFCNKNSDASDNESLNFHSVFNSARKTQQSQM